MRDCRRGYLQNLFISTATCLMRPIEGLKQSHFHNKFVFQLSLLHRKNAHYFCSKYPPKAFFKGIYYCPKVIIIGLTDKGQFQYLTKLKGPQEDYLYTTQFP